MTATGVTIRGDVRRATEPVIVEPADGGPPVAVYPVPYLDPTLAGPALAFAAEPEPEPETDVTLRRRLRHDEVTRLATDRIRADLAARRGARSVVVAHTFVEGGVTCESERELTVGNIESVRVDAFSGFDYVALGHLHGSQDRDGARVSYSGTPLPYSFSEEGQTKSVRIVEIASDATLTVEVVPLGVGRSLRTIEGTIDDLLGRAEFADAEPARVRVLLTDTYLPMQAMARLRERFPYAAELRHRPEGVEPGSGGATERATADPAASPLALTLQFWAEQHGAGANAAEAELLGTALDAVGRSADQ
jgi:exonuclease SbcD